MEGWILMKSKSLSRDDQINLIQKKIDRLKLEAKEIWKSGGSVLKYEKAIATLTFELKRLKNKEKITTELINEIPC
jgi:hypothetical protein